MCLRRRGHTLVSGRAARRQAADASLRYRTFGGTSG
jgi:hypothetical protein